MDIPIEEVLGRPLPMIVKPSMRRLQCRDPRSVDNFLRSYKKFAQEHHLLERAKELEKKSSFPMSPADHLEYEELDKLHCSGVERAERHCRKLKAGIFSFC